MIKKLLEKSDTISIHMRILLSKIITIKIQWKSEQSLIFFFFYIYIYRYEPLFKKYQQNLNFDVFIIFFYKKALSI